MTRLPLVLVCASRVAGAQPVTHPEPDPCKVTVVLAPAEVRAEIESWVAAEPHCARELEVRVVPTDDGLYLQARDRSGRVRERVVPDAQSAAVLVVSWMADDSIPTGEPTAGDHAEILLPPAPQVIDREDGIAAAAAPVRSPRRWLQVGALASERSGIRGQLDLIAGSRWTLGIAGGVRHDHGPQDATGQARLLIGTARSFGRISLRAQLGIGVDTTTEEHVDHDRMMEGPGGVVPVGEAGVLANIHVRGDWGLFGGPLVEAAFDRDHPTLSMFLGVQRGL